MSIDPVHEHLPHDYVVPFQIESSHLRGRLVRLGPVLTKILGAHDYPEPVARMLAEAVVLMVTLSDMIKFGASFSLQTKSDGPISMIIVDINHLGEVRGYARYDDELVKRTIGQSSYVQSPIPILLGKGYMALTIDPGDVGGKSMDRYQGIVALEGNHFHECAEAYFQQSEQLMTKICLVSDFGVNPKTGKAMWRAGCMMLQRVPQDGGSLGGDEPMMFDLDTLDQQDHWDKARIFMETLTPEELLNEALVPEKLLLRLFHEDGVRIYENRKIVHGCRCYREKILNLINSFSQDDQESMKVDGNITLVCEFCNKKFVWDGQELSEHGA